MTGRKPVKVCRPINDMTEHPADEWGVCADFSLVLGGPLFQLLLRARLVKPSMELVHRRVLASIAITWLPLAAMTLAAGSFLGGVSVPFLFDLDTHIRFLVSLPLLLVSELIVHSRLRPLVGQFLREGLVAPQDRLRFDAIIASTWRLRNSVLAEVLLLALSFVGGYWLWRTQVTLNVASWYAVPAAGSMNYTPAGYWYAFVSLPIARFILFRWYFRLVIWYMFLWRLSRLRLRLNPLHPDRAGGLGFLNVSILAFAPVLTAQSMLLAGAIGNRIWHEGAKLPDFKLVMGCLVVFWALSVLLPLGFFAFEMVGAKRTALRDYGTLASNYADKFALKWLHGDGTAGEELLGTPDIQSLADLANSYDVVRGMRALPLDRGAVVGLVLLIALPLVPLVLTMVPLSQIALQLVSLVL